MTICKNVLLVDDDEIFNLVTEQMLKVHNFTEQVTPCTGVDQGFSYLMSLIREGNGMFPDIILLDINMPEKDGWDFLNSYRQLPQGVKEKTQLYMLSSSVNEFDVLKSQQYEDVRDFIRKPLTKKDLDIIRFRLER